MTIHSLLIQKLLSTNSHIGRRITTNHFKPYTYGTRNGFSIIDSDKTLISLRAALSFISSLIRLNPSSRFLFVNTNPLHDEIVHHMKRKIGVKDAQEYWKLTGFLTNNSTPKKFKGRRKRLCFAPPVAPDCVVIVDAKGKGKGRNAVVNEATRVGVPIVGLVDSGTEWRAFEKITYPVPCNDSAQFVYLFCNLITKTFLYEKKRIKKEEEEKPGKGRIKAAVEEVNVGGKGRSKAVVDGSSSKSESSSIISSSSEEENDPSSDDSESEISRISSSEEGSDPSSESGSDEPKEGKADKENSNKR